VFELWKRTSGHYRYVIDGRFEAIGIAE